MPPTCPTSRNKLLEKAYMLIREVEQRISYNVPNPSKPRTPQQARLDALKTQKDNVSRALDTERKRQKVTKARQNLTKAMSA